MMAYILTFFSLEISFKRAVCQALYGDKVSLRLGCSWASAEQITGPENWGLVFVGGTGRYGSCTRACPLKLEMDQRYGFIFQDVFLPGCQMPFVTPPTLLSIRIWAKGISELKEFLSIRHLAKEAVPAPPESLGSWRKTLPAPCCLAGQLCISAAA